MLRYIFFPITRAACLCLLWSSSLPKVLHKIMPRSIAQPLVLCVEDETTALSIRKKVLQQAGYKVIGVTSAGAAMQVLQEFPVCATIADHMLHGTTGTELAKKMKKLKPDVPIILFSGSLPERLDAVDVYISKGEPTAEFLRIVRAVVERACS